MRTQQPDLVLVDADLLARAGRELHKIINILDGCIALAIVVMLAAGAVAIASTSGCTHASSIASAVIDCTRSDNSAKIDAVEAELKLLTGWDGRYARATAAGAVIGGCALLRLLEHGGAPPASSVLPDQGWLTFERFRREQAGGASFQTTGGLK